MQFKDTLRKLVLLSITAFAVFSCITVDKTLGEQYVPKDQDLELRIAEFKLPVEIKTEDSLQAISTEYAIVGAIKTAEFGLATFGAAANICQPVTKFRFGKDPVIKHIYFSAAVANRVIMDNSQAGIPQDIFIYRTTKEIDSSTLWNKSLTVADYNPVPLNLSSATYFGGDSIKVYLNNNYGTEILSATEKELDSINVFIKRFKGLYIQSSTPENGLNGGRMNHLSYTSASIVIKYNFQPTWKTGLDRKDTTVIFSFGNGFCLNTSSYSTAHLDTTQPQTELPIEGVAGVKPYINAHALKEMLNTWAENNDLDFKNIVIAKASFSFPFEIPANLDMTKYPTYLYPTYKSDSLTHYYYPFKDINSTGNSKGALNRSLCDYQGDMSSTIQKIINTTVTPDKPLSNEYNFWMAPIRSEEDPYYGTVSYVSDIYNYYVGKVNGPKAERYPKLTIVYTVLR